MIGNNGKKLLKKTKNSSVKTLVSFLIRNHKRHFHNTYITQL